VRSRIGLLSTSARLYTANRVAVPPRASALQVREVEELNGGAGHLRIVCLSRVVRPEASAEYVCS
jgi:hypothetical protein